MGLSAGLWLLVLGASGFVLDHRDWRWLWQSGVHERWLPETVIKKSRAQGFRLYQRDAAFPGLFIIAGSTGMWWRDDSVNDWVATRFENNESPQVIAMVDDIPSAGKIKWLATDDGIWRLTDRAKQAGQWALQAHVVNSLTPGSAANELLGVVDRSRVFRFNTDTGKIIWLKLQPLQTSTQLPESIDLNRLVRDLHFGRGFFPAPWSLLWNDLSAIALIVLPLGGLLYWSLPRYWKRKRRQGRPVKKRRKQQTIRLLYRAHAPVAGLLSVIPILYLSISGIFLDHAEGLRAFMKSVNITRAWQTPVYQLRSWKGEIYNVAAYPGAPEKISIGTRLGLFSSEDNGRRWYREALMRSDKANAKSAFIWMMKRIGNDLYTGGMGAPNFVKHAGEGWRRVKGVGHMPRDVTIDAEGRAWWLSREGLRTDSPNTGHIDSPASWPKQKNSRMVPWYFIFDALHSGLLIHSQWKWINDGVAMLSIFLLMTGLLRWWRVKWV